MMSSPSTALQALKQPMLINIGKRSISTRGFKHDILEEHLKEHLGKPLNQQWCDVGCMARVFWGRNTDSHRREMRKRLPKAFLALLDRNMFLVIERAPNCGGHHGEALAAKIYNPSEMGLERQHATDQLERARRRNEFTKETYKKAQQLLGFETAQEIEATA